MLSLFDREFVRMYGELLAIPWCDETPKDLSLCEDTILRKDLIIDAEETP